MAVSELQARHVIHLTKLARCKPPADRRPMPRGGHHSGMSFVVRGTDTFMAGTSWVLVAAAVVAIISVGVVVAVRRGRRVEASEEHAVLDWCVAHGHAYAIHNTGWRCGVCGNYVARREGERYGRPEDGLVDRRRTDRTAAREDRAA